MKILINALSGIGDAIMFSPALSAMKKHLPDSTIDMLVMFLQVKDIYAANPNINNIYYYDFLNQSRLKSFKDISAVRRNGYDVSINVYPSNRKEYNLLNFRLGAGKRIATKYLHYSAGNLDFFNTNLVKEVKDRHNVIENFNLLKTIVPNAEEEELDKLELYLGAKEETFAKNFIESNKLSGKKLVGFHAGSATLKGHINKRWSADKYIELAKKLNQQFDARILIFGTEKDLNDKIHEAAKEFSFIPPVKNIMESLALMKQCSLFVSNDTGLMHLAAALQIPTVAVFAYTNYKELYPWQNSHIIVRKDLPCSPCFFNSPKPVKCIFKGEEQFKCIKTISVNEVIKACEKLIQEVPGNIKP